MEHNHIEEVLPGTPRQSGETPAGLAASLGTKPDWPGWRLGLRVTQDVAEGALLASVPLDSPAVLTGQDPGDLARCLIRHTVEDGALGSGPEEPSAQTGPQGTQTAARAAARWLMANVAASPAVRLAAASSTANHVAALLEGTALSAF